MPKPCGPLVCYQYCIGLISTCIRLYLHVHVSKFCSLYLNVSLCIKMVSQGIKIHFDNPSNFLYFWNAFVGKFRYLQCIEMVSKFSYCTEIHFDKLLNLLDLKAIAINDFNTYTVVSKCISYIKMIS